MENNEHLIEELLSKAQKAKEPGTMDNVIFEGSEDQPAPMILSELKSAGYVYVWDNRTGERSVVNRNMLQKQLEKKRSDGSRVFTTIKPKIEPKRGTLKCWLHEDDPNREHYNELGLPVCRKSNLTSPFMVKRHMQKRHKDEYAAIEEERKERERLDELQFRRSLMKANVVEDEVSEVTTAEPELYISDNPKPLRKRKSR